MSALTDYYQQAVKQRELLAIAQERDYVALGLWDKERRDGKHRIWTRQDRNRCVEDGKTISQVSKNGRREFIEIIDPDGNRRRARKDTRLDRLLRCYLDPQWKWVDRRNANEGLYGLKHHSPTTKWSIVNWHRRALAEAQELGTYPVIARLLEDATASHKNLLYCYEEVSEIERGEWAFDHERTYPWDEVEPPHTAALSRLSLYLPPSEPMEPLPLPAISEGVNRGGRPMQELTQIMADFVKAKLAKEDPPTWAQIELDFNMKFNRNDISQERLRSAHRRVYGKKSV